MILESVIKWNNESSQESNFCTVQDLLKIGHIALCYIYESIQYDKKTSKAVNITSGARGHSIPQTFHEETHSGRRACREHAARIDLFVANSVITFLSCVCHLHQRSRRSIKRQKSLLFFHPPPVILKPLSGGWIAKLVQCIVLKGFALDAGLRANERVRAGEQQTTHCVSVWWHWLAWVLPLSATRMAWHPQHNPSCRKSKGIDSATNHTLSQPGAELQ